jgi:DNA excision repair protein ERCC-5
MFPPIPAQCVELEWLGLVDGVISDDSDVWPFGAHYVYRHMFSRRKHVQEYAAEAIAQNFGFPFLFYFNSI